MTCIACGKSIAKCLLRLGSLHCHDCRAARLPAPRSTPADEEPSPRSSPSPLSQGGTETLTATVRAWPRNALDAQLVATAAYALYAAEGRWPSDKVGRTVRRLAEKSYVTMKSADYILVAGFERPDVFATVASGTAWPYQPLRPSA